MKNVWPNPICSNIVVSQKNRLDWDLLAFIASWHNKHTLDEWRGLKGAQGWIISLRYELSSGSNRKPVQRNRWRTFARDMLKGYMIFSFENMILCLTCTVINTPIIVMFQCQSVHMVDFKKTVDQLQWREKYKRMIWYVCAGFSKEIHYHIQ